MDTFPLPTGRFRTIVADPPWTPTLGGMWGARVDKGRPQHFYDTMSLEAIKALSVPAADQAHLYLWAVSQHIDWGYDVARAWGFEPVTTLTWCKPGLGVGRFRCNTEHLIVARKGSRHGNPFGQGGRHAQATDRTWFEWPRGRHSEKPQEAFEMIERLSPGPRLELFARRQRPGWTVWGNEVTGICQRCSRPITFDTGDWYHDNGDLTDNRFCVSEYHDDVCALPRRGAE